MAVVEVELDLPEGVEVCGYERLADGHVFDVAWQLPVEVECRKCGCRQKSRVQYADKVQVIRDLDIHGQPSFFVFQPPFHRCQRCCHRQYFLAPFKREHVTVTARFEEHVLSLLVGSTEEEVARRLAISAEMVRGFVNHRMTQVQPIDPERVITDLGMDEISLKKRHKLYATILTDLSDPEHPRVLAVSAGRDEAAATSCLEQLSEGQRAAVQTHRTDMSPAYAAATKSLLPNSQHVIDRFHVAKKLGEVVDRLRTKDSCIQENAVEGSTEEVPFPDVAVPQTA